MAPARAPSHWAVHSKDLRGELREAVDRDLLRRLHRLRPHRHGRVVLTLALAVAAVVWVLTRPLPLWASLPFSLVLGFFLFDTTVLLHETVHRLVFPGGRERATRMLALLYALPSAISPSQFQRWHLDHHEGLGSSTEDPKRHHLSPKRNARWFKALYFTPALFALYFRAAKREAATYEKPLRQRIAVERLGNLAIHALAVGFLYGAGGWGLLSRLYLVPYLFGFPLAFALNRLGQHYDIDPKDSARWGTRMRPSRFWDALFLWSSYHLEHHYFPGVPFYNLRRLNGALQPFFERRAVPERTYRWLVRKYLIENRPPHTHWA